jgi:hypothetical protein
MKKFADVEKTRIEYHKDGLRNSVHRASLLVPEIEGTSTQISFINHFLLKRGYEDVGCKVTGLDDSGKRIHANLTVLDKPKVYTMDLSDLFEGKASSYIVEFFCGRNMFIPFPAVMVNHYGEGFVNTVHAYNRVLNDVFEDDAINESQVSESSIDILVNDQYDTFVMFQSGDQKCLGELKFELIYEGVKYTKSLPLDVKRFCSKVFKLSEVFSELSEIRGGFLKVVQPTQNMFYGRLLVGVQDKSSGAFSGNHSYYDTSEVNEYWGENIESTRMYPFMPDYQNIIRMYPIQAKGALQLSAKLFDKLGSFIRSLDLGELNSPSGEYLDFNLNQGIEKYGITEDKVGAIEVVASSLEKIPMRINHQLVFKKSESKLFSSVNLSLFNAQVFQSKGKKGFSWGQMIIDKDTYSKLGVVFNTSSGSDEPIEVSFYDGQGLLCEKRVDLRVGQSALFSTDEDSFYESIERPIVGRNIWYTISSNRPDITGVVVSTNRSTLHTTGEHSY